MDEEDVREHARALCDALVAGDVDRAIGEFSDELRHNLGEVISLLPLPATAATVESVEHAGPGYNAQLRVVSETEEVVLQTRWKERDGHPTLIELSHLSKAELAPPEDVGPADADAAAEEPAEPA